MTNARQLGLRCVGVTKSLGGTPALQNIEVELDPTRLTAIVGPNGAGKTTLINVLTGFLRPDSGECYFGSHRISGLSPHRIVKLGVARTFQDQRLIERITTLENVLLAQARQHTEAIFSAVLRSGMNESAERAEAMRILDCLGLAGKAAEPAARLSYGQQKLLSVACCLATEARTILLDEPVAGVDPESSLHMQQVLQSLQAAGKHIVFIEHDLAAVRRIAEHLIVMDHGRIIAQGPPGDVLARSEIIEAYVG